MCVMVYALKCACENRPLCVCLYVCVRACGVRVDVGMSFGVIARMCECVCVCQQHAYVRLRRRMCVLMCRIHELCYAYDDDAGHATYIYTFICEHNGLTH